MPSNNGVRQMIRKKGRKANVPVGRRSVHELRASLAEREFEDIADVADRMREDWQVQFIERILEAHIKSAKVTVSNKGDEGGERANLLADHFINLWQQTLPSMIDAIGDGRVAFERVLDFNADAMLTFTRKLDPLPFRNTEMVLEDDGSYSGIHLKTPAGEDVIPPDYSWWLALDATAVEPHGRSRFVGAPLREYQSRVDTRKLRMKLIQKFCLRGGIAYGPTTVEDENGEIVEVVDSMQKAYDELQAGGLLFLPGDRDADGSRDYEFVETEKIMDPAPIDNTMRESDIRMLRAFGISELAVSQTSDVGSFAMAVVHRLVLMSVVEGILSQFATSFQKYVIDKDVDLNFSDDDKPLIEISWPSLTDVPGDLIVKIAENILMSPQLSPLVLAGVVDIVQLFDAVGVPVSEDVEERIIAALKFAKEQAEQEGQQQQEQGPPGQANFANINLAAQRAPKGGATIAGKDYKGGMFIPADELAKANDEELEALQEAQQAAEGGTGGEQSQQRQTRVKKKNPSQKTKSEIAKASAKRVASDIQRYSEEGNEPELAEALGGAKLDDNEPADVVVDIDGRHHGIELKTMVDNRANKITMKREAMQRKASWERKNRGTMHTVVFDDQNVFNANGPGQHDKSQRRILYRRGYGSFRTDTMHEVSSMDELKELMTLRNNQLPQAARKPAQRRRRR